MKILLSFLLLSLAGCSHLPSWQEDAEVRQVVAEEPLLMHTERLANNLFSSLAPIEYGNLAVVSFTELETLALSKANHSLNMLGLQLQESMLAVSTQRGFNVVEIRAANQVQLFKDYEKLLSRDSADISKDIDVRYMVVGTLLQGNQTTTINARLLDLREGTVIAAVSDNIPNSVIGLNANQIQMKHNKLYRSSL
ncbi:FlgO family outer membrane protein [uncultured Paraglaciecola sp.]|uniref:FlgO family outer membrane protein n=1 Tax=uncultured Paraglaciecola sp. TaxID=1765024 RepID=UPI0030D88B2A